MSENAVRILMQERAEDKMPGGIMHTEVSGSHSRPRHIAVILTSLIAVFISLYHLYVFLFGFGRLDEIYGHRPIHLLTILVLVFLTYSFSSRKREASEKIPIADSALALLSFVVMIYFVLNTEHFLHRVQLVDHIRKLDWFFGISAIVLVFEATRRAVGPWLPAVTFPFLVYLYVGPFMPGDWYHPGLSIEGIIDAMTMTNFSLWGVTTAVASSYIILFVIFGQFLIRSGAGEFFTQLAYALGGRARGGPAKAAVIASGLLGTVSGSAPANVAVSGAFTIPMMKKVGFKPYFAGAVEASASTGGMIMPPVMGTTIFIMSEITGIPFIRIAMAAFPPAVLYYLALYIQVHMEAVKFGISGLPKEELPRLGQVLRDGWYLALPLVVIVGILSAGYSPIRAAICAIPTTILVSQFRKETRMGIKEIGSALEQGAKSMMIITPTVALAGLIIGGVFISGLGPKLSSSVQGLTGSSPFLALLIGMFSCLILGLPMSGIVSYILTAILIVPALVGMGNELLAAHLFAFYFSVIAALSPPVGAAFFTAAAISRAPPMKTGWHAMLLAIGGFIVPFLFVYRPALVLIGNPIEIASSLTIAGISVSCIALAVSGRILTKLNLIERVLLFSGGMLLIFPGMEYITGGIALTVLTVAWNWRKFRSA